VREAQTTQAGPLHEALARLAYTEAALANTQASLAQVTAERDKLRRAYEQLKEQLELLRRRIFQAKAERIDVTQLEIEFAEVKKDVEALAVQMGEAMTPPPADEPPPAPPPARPRPKPTGRRNLAEEEMPEERVEILDPALEGVAERIDFEESCKLRYRRGGAVRIVVARARYKSTTTDDRPGAAPEVKIVTASSTLVERNPG
jgi:hypothetical protein